MPSRSKARKPVTVSIDAAVPVTVPGPLAIVAADVLAMPGHRRGFAAGYLATSGHYGLHARPAPSIGQDSALIAELRALAHAATALGDQPVTFMTSNAQAARFLSLWRAGITGQFPDGYRLERLSGKQPTLAVFAGKLADTAGSQYQVAWAQGHAGYPLMETADSLARLAASTARREFSHGEAQRIAGQWVTAALKALSDTGVSSGG